MSLYLWLNLGIIFFPFVLSFDKKVAFWRRWLPLLISMVIVSGFFIVWDVYMTVYNHWSFSPELAGTFKIFTLPLGEWMFFISTPYACIFIYECVRAYFKEIKVKYIRLIMGILGSLGIILPFVGYLVRGQLLVYTFTNGIVFSIAIYLIVFLQKDTYQSSWALIAIALTYIPFLIFNGVFTNIPIVSYNPDSILGVRLLKLSFGGWTGLGIPLEDFFYSYSLITLTLFFYLIFRKYSIGEKKRNE